MEDDEIRWRYSVHLHRQESCLQKGLGSKGEVGKAEIWGWKGETSSAAAGERGHAGAPYPGYLHIWGMCHQVIPTPPVREAGNPCTKLLSLGGCIIIIPFYFGLGRQFITLRQHRLAPAKAAALFLRCLPLKHQANFEFLLS